MSLTRRQEKKRYRKAVTRQKRAKQLKRRRFARYDQDAARRIEERVARTIEKAGAHLPALGSAGTPAFPWEARIAELGHALAGIPRPTLPPECSDLRREEERNARQLELGQGNRFSRTQRVGYLKLLGAACESCGRAPQRKHDEVELILRHVVDVQHGGQAEFRNVEIICTDCLEGGRSIFVLPRRLLDSQYYQSGLPYTLRFRILQRFNDAGLIDSRAVEARVHRGAPSSKPRTHVVRIQRSGRGVPVFDWLMCCLSTLVHERGIAGRLSREAEARILAFVDDHVLTTPVTGQQQRQVAAA